MGCCCAFHFGAGQNLEKGLLFNNMTKQEENDFKKVVIDAFSSPEAQKAIVGALSSQEGQGAIVSALGSQKGQDAIVGAMSSSKGQDAIVGAMSNSKGQGAIKTGALAALKSEEGQELLVDSFIEGYNEIAQPTIEDMWDDIRELKTEVKHIGDRYNIRLQRLERKIGVAA